MFRILLFSVLISVAMPISAAAPKILVVGDSISAGYGIDFRQGWVQLLQQRLKIKGYPHQLVNASISGDTSAGAKARLPGALKRHRPKIVIIEIGGNDGLQGLSADMMYQNLGSMIAESRKHGAKVLLLGMRLPPNYGIVYTEKFFSVYRRIAKERGVLRVPFFLDGVAGQSALMQVDGIHPREEAQPTLLDNMWPMLEKLMEK